MIFYLPFNLKSMHYRCVVIDDEQPSINMLTELIKAVPGLELLAATTDPVEGVGIIRGMMPDVVFLDIDMPVLSGLEIARLIHKDTRIVFCTAYPQFALDGYEVDALDYLLKPIPFNRFMRTAERIFKQLHAHRPGDADDDYIFVRTDHNSKFERVDLDELEYIEARGNYVALCSAGNRKIMTHTSMESMEKKLLSDNFMRVHRSFIVALSKIRLIEHGRIILKGSEKEISVGENYREEFRERIRLKFISPWQGK